MYWALFICLLAAALLAYGRKRDDRGLYALPFLLLSLALCLRFGQGTDYSNYHFLYEHPAGHGEKGYSWLTQTCRELGLTFPQFIILFSIPMCVFTHRALMKYSHCRPLSGMHGAGKPTGYICIAPVLAARVLGKFQPELTIGNDAGTAGALREMGARHVDAPADGIVIDRQNRIVSTPAYMLTLKGHAALQKVQENFP